MEKDTDTPVTEKKITHRATAARNTTQQHKKVQSKYTTAERETRRFLAGLRYGSLFQPGPKAGLVKEGFSLWRLFIQIRDFKRRHFSLSTLLLYMIGPRTSRHQRRVIAVVLRIISGGLIIALIIGLIFHIVIAIALFLWDVKYLIIWIWIGVWGFRFSMKLEKLDRKSQTKK